MGTLLSYLQSATSNLSKTKVSRKIKTLDLKTKMLYLGCFRLKFENTFEIRTFQLAKMQTVVLKERTLDLGPKMP